MGTFGSTFGQYSRTPITNPLAFLNERVFHATSRSGTTLVDQFGNNATILTPAVYLTGTTSYMRIATSSLGITGGAAWDATFKFKLDDKTRRDCVFYNGGNANGTKGITIMPYNGDLIVYTSDGTTFVTATLPCNFQSLTNYTLRIQWNGLTGGTLTATVNGVPFTTTTTRGWSGAPSATNTDFGAYASAFYFKGVYRSAVGTFGGYSINLHPTGLNASEYDLSIPGRVLGFSRLNGTTRYDGDSTYYLDYGYSVQKQKITNTILYVPNTTSGGTVSLQNYVTNGVDIISEIAGSSKHNLFLSKIRFQNAFFDRSNTTIWNATGRGGYYDASNTKDFFIDEINYKTLRTFLNNGYAGMFYPKFTGNSIDDRQTMDELILLSVDKKNTTEILVLRYTGDIYRCQRKLDGTYYLDANNYLQLYLYDDLGGDAEANFAYYQALITSGATQIGSDRYEVAVISQPLTIPDNTSLSINMELRAKKGTQTTLTAPVALNGTVINVASTSGYNVGEWIVISDSSMVILGGGGGTRRVGAAGKITAIGTNTLTIHEGSRYAIPATGYVKHMQSVILLENKSNVTISGNGGINGNYAYQADAEPVDTSGVEQVKMACGISCVGCSNIQIASQSNAFTIKKAALHGVVFSNSNDCGINSITLANNHDKNMLCMNTNRTSVRNTITKNTITEDGFTFYLSNKDFVIDNVTIDNCTRIGLNILSNGNCNATITNVHTSDLINLASSSFNMSDVTVTGNGGILITDAYSNGNNITLSNINFTNVTTSVLLNFQGAIHDISVNNLTFNGCNGTAILADKQSSGSVYPTNITITNGGITNHTGTTASILGSSSVQFSNFTGL